MQQRSKRNYEWYNKGKLHALVLQTNIKAVRPHDYEIWIRVKGTEDIFGGQVDDDETINKC